MGHFFSGEKSIEQSLQRIGNKNGFPFVEVTCFFVGVTRFFLKSNLQDDRSLMEPGRALQVTFLLEKS